MPLSRDFRSRYCFVAPLLAMTRNVIASAARQSRWAQAGPAEKNARAHSRAPYRMPMKFPQTALRESGNPGRRGRNGDPWAPACGLGHAHIFKPPKPCFAHAVPSSAGFRWLCGSTPRQHKPGSAVDPAPAPDARQDYSRGRLASCQTGLAPPVPPVLPGRDQALPTP